VPLTSWERGNTTPTCFKPTPSDVRPCREKATVRCAGKTFDRGLRKHDFRGILISKTQEVLFWTSQLVEGRPRTSSGLRWTRLSWVYLSMNQEAWLSGTISG
jgi:hypothetical protein